MITKFRIEFWNPSANRYETGWEGTNFEMADKMVFKPYNRLHTRRLVRVTEEVIYSEKGKK